MSHPYPSGRDTDLIVDSVLVNAKAYFKREIVDCAIAIENGEVFKIGKETQMPKADQRFVLNKSLVLPGLIDPHVHLRDEGKAYKEDFYTGTAAAAAGGVTTVLDMPNNAPVTMSAETLGNRIKIAKKKILVNVGFYSEFPIEPKGIRDIVDEGAVAFKLFMGKQVGGLGINDDRAVEGALRKAGELGVPVAVHAEDEKELKKNEEKMRRSNRHDVSAFREAHEEIVELKAIERLLRITEKTGAALHFCHITTEEGLSAIIRGKKTGRLATCEVTPHHLLLSSDDFGRYGMAAVTIPPLRGKRHIKALWNGILNGWIDVLGSDHAPHAFREKDASSIWDVKAGIPGLETTLPLVMSLVMKKRISLDRAVSLLSEKPAEIFGLKDRGLLEEGKKADLVVVDLKKKFKIDASKFHSKAKYSPFDGWEVQGKLLKTFVNGRLVMEDDEIVEKAGCGVAIRRNSV